VNGDVIFVIKYVSMFSLALISRQPSEILAIASTDAMKPSGRAMVWYIVGHLQSFVSSHQGKAVYGIGLSCLTR
jgi:hypothetical protein